MSNKVDPKKKYSETRREINMLELLGFIKEVSYRYEGHNNVDHSIYKARRRLFTLYQGKEVIEKDYIERFNISVALLYQIGAT